MYVQLFGEDLGPLGSDSFEVYYLVQLFGEDLGPLGSDSFEVYYLFVDSVRWFVGVPFVLLSVCC